MQVPQNQDYNIFTALIESIHKKDRGKLRFVKCQNCGRLNAFRLISVTSSKIKCKKCGSNIQI
ncbi:MAG: hypothetical protein CW716_08050 [Candidatus Bathyarchaeum sp.]|nr:MAG: hypothetical protein CW716_08050 [Candidatus Bathyarchaeum sp.]